MRTHPPPHCAKANEQRGRTEPASPGLVTAKSGRTLASGASADHRAAPMGLSLPCGKARKPAVGAGTDETGPRWSLGLFAVGKGGEGGGCDGDRGKLGEGRRVGWESRLGLLSIRRPGRRGISLIAMSDQRLCLWKPPPFGKGWTETSFRLWRDRTGRTPGPKRWGPMKPAFAPKGTEPEKNAGGIGRNCNKPRPLS